MHFVITSDIQLHPHQPWSKLLPNGMNDRLGDGLNCLRQAFDCCDGGGILIINGDLFHDRKSLSLDTIYYTKELFKEYEKIPVILSVGNHDQFLRDGKVNSLVILDGIKNDIAVTPKMFEIGGVRFNIIPFFENTDAFKAEVNKCILSSTKLNVLLMHQGVDGASLAKGSKAKDKISLGDLRLDDFDLVLSGHYHRPQQMTPNFFYIGSPYEIDEGEAGDEKRFLCLAEDNIPEELEDMLKTVWQGKGWNLSHVPVVDMPKHLLFESIEDYQASPYFGQRHFVTVKCKDDIEIKQAVQSGVRVRVTDEDTSGDVGDVSGELTVYSALETFLTAKNRKDLLAEARNRAKC